MWVLIAVIVVLLVVALVWGARKSREADSELSDMNRGKTNGSAIFGIFDRDHRR